MQATQGIPGQVKRDNRTTSAYITARVPRGKWIEKLEYKNRRIPQVASGADSPCSPLSVRWARKDYYIGALVSSLFSHTLVSLSIGLSCLREPLEPYCSTRRRQMCCTMHNAYSRRPGCRGGCVRDVQTCAYLHLMDRLEAFSKVSISI